MHLKISPLVTRCMTFTNFCRHALVRNTPKTPLWWPRFGPHLVAQKLRLEGRKQKELQQNGIEKVVLYEGLLRPRGVNL